MKITSRSDLGKLFLHYKQKGIGAEIGVQNGFNAANIYKDWQDTIILVDNWIREDEYIMASNNMADKEAIFIKSDSVKAAAQWLDECLDWVYIDAGHSYKEVKADFEAWYPKVREGGIVSGHDYGENDCIGVKLFIDEYMKLHPEIEMNFTTDDFWNGMEYQTWWFVKPTVFDGMAIGV